MIDVWVGELFTVENREAFERLQTSFDGDERSGNQRTRWPLHFKATSDEISLLVLLDLRFLGFQMKD